MFYICGMRRSPATRAAARAPARASRAQVADLGSVFTTTGFGTQTGYFGAWTPPTGKSCGRSAGPSRATRARSRRRAGSSSSAGTAASSQAYDAENGEQLWSFQTGAGANSTVTVFEHDGKQYLAFLAGGNALAATPHGDNLWLFSLDGTLGPGRGGRAAQATGHAGESTGGAEQPATGDAAAGEAGLRRQLLRLPRRRRHRRQRRPVARRRRRNVDAGASRRSRTAAAGCRPSRAR